MHARIAKGLQGAAALLLLLHISVVGATTWQPAPLTGDIIGGPNGGKVFHEVVPSPYWPTHRGALVGAFAGSVAGLGLASRETRSVIARDPSVGIVAILILPLGFLLGSAVGGVAGAATAGVYNHRLPRQLGPDGHGVWFFDERPWAIWKWVSVGALSGAGWGYLLESSSPRSRCTPDIVLGGAFLGGLIGLMAAGIDRLIT